MKARAALFGLIALIPGCCGMCGMCSDSTKSSNVRTAGVNAEIRARQREAGPTDVSVRVRVGGMLSNTFLTITDGDALTAENGTDKITLVGHSGMIATPSNDGALPGDSSGRLIAVKFVRPHDVSALGSSVVMPSGMTFLAPPAGAPFDAAHPKLVIAWAPVSSEPVGWSVQGPCVEGQHDTATPDPGRLELTLVAAHDADGGLAAPCDVVLHLERQRTGSLDPAFGEGGSIVATLERDRVVHFTP